MTVCYVGSEVVFFGSFVRRRSTSAIVACLSLSFVRRTVTSSDIVDGLRRFCVLPLRQSNITSPFVLGVSFVGSYTVT